MGKLNKFGNRNVHNKVKVESQIKSRKLLRKEKRLAKKERNREHFKSKFQNSNTNTSITKVISRLQQSGNNDNSTRKEVRIGRNNVKLNKKKTVSFDESTLNSYEFQSLNHKNEVISQKKLMKEMKAQRRKQFFEENKNEDKVIKKLEKQLHLNKRKSKSLPRSFVDEGLDYLLDVCDSDKIKDSIEAEKNLQDSGSEFEEDFAIITGKERKRKKSDKLDAKETEEIPKSDGETNDFSDSDFDTDNDFDEVGSGSDISEEDEPVFKKLKGSEKHTENSDNENDLSYSEEEDGSSVDDDCDAVENDSDSDCESTNNSDDDNKEDVTEDIYGRKRDKCGNIIPDNKKYVPPHLKMQSSSSDREEQLARLKKQVKGLMNRLAESNMHSIVSQMDQLYMQNSRNDMNDTLTKLTFDSVIQPNSVPERLVVEHTMLIAALHANVGTEVGAHFIQAVAERFHSSYGEWSDSSKEIDNIMLVIAYLYSFKLFNCVLLFDILNRVTDATRFGEKEVELLLIVLRSVGFNLRKDDPVSLKNIIVKVQSIVNNSTELSNQSRVKFMLDILAAVKNNNMTKIPNYDPSLIEHHKKLLKNLIRKGKYISELNITLDDLLRAPERGKWWVVGSAWTGGDVTKPKNANDEEDINSRFDKPYLDLAKKHRMNTELRRNVFCVLMSAEDYMDAFEKLLRLGLKGPQEQTIVQVVVHCVLQEKTFNLYYAFVAAKFCTTDRKHQMTLQYHLWDKIRELGNLETFQITNLALFLAHLILEKALPLSVLKVIEFATLSKPYVRLLRRLFLTILLHNNDEIVAEVFQKIAKSSKLNIFKESIRLFFHHFILKNINSDTDQMEKLKQRVKLAENSMNSRTLLEI